MKGAWPARLRVRARVAAGVALTAGLAGCALVTPPPAPPRLAMLDRLPAEPVARAAAARPAVTLRVAVPQAPRAFDTPRMAYRLRAHEIAYYRDHEWGATPPEMLQPLLVATLQRTGAFAAVLAAPAAGPSTYVVETHLGALVQDFTGATDVVRLSLHVQLHGPVHARARSREFAVTEPMARRTPEAGIDAANRATAKALQAVAAFVLESVAAD